LSVRDNHRALILVFDSLVTVYPLQQDLHHRMSTEERDDGNYRG
jgi:hypothetical protein